MAVSPPHFSLRCRIHSKKRTAPLQEQSENLSQKYLQCDIGSESGIRFMAGQAPSNMALGCKIETTRYPASLPVTECTPKHLQYWTVRAPDAISYAPPVTSVGTLCNGIKHLNAVGQGKGRLRVVDGMPAALAKAANIDCSRLASRADFSRVPCTECDGL